MAVDEMTLGLFVEQMLMLGLSHGLDKIYKYEIFYFGHTFILEYLTNPPMLIKNTLRPVRE
jgi:hypothetical protein